MSSCQIALWMIGKKFWVMVCLEIMGIPLYIENIGFTIREKTFCSLITTIDLLIMEPSQRKCEYTLHNFKFINYQRNKLCFNFDSAWWGTSETPWSSWILNIAVDKRESFALTLCFWCNDGIGLWNPFRKDSSLDYENNSDEEWEEVIITKSLW